MTSKNIIDYHIEQPTTMAFGPFLRGYCIKPSFCEEVLRRGQQTNISHSKALAGIIEKENVFCDDDRKFFAESISWVLQDYRTEQNKIYRQQDIDSDGTIVMPQYKLESLWINFMKNEESNPGHTHDGDLSFVLYLKIDEALIEENKKYNGKSAGPGSIYFEYGEAMDWVKYAHGFFPIVNTMYVFPAKLRHRVNPFKSNSERISVSGNFIVMNKNRELIY